MMRHLYSFLFFCFFVSFISCDENRIFEENVDISNYKWNYEDSIHFKIQIKDQVQKNLYINFRHTNSFPRRNVRLNMKIKAPNGETTISALNVLLSEPNGMWFGKCSGDICTMQFPIREYTSYSFKDSGIYEFTLNQDMRINPLPETMSIGLRLENAVE